jgi:hypothetical protein
MGLLTTEIYYGRCELGKSTHRNPKWDRPKRKSRKNDCDYTGKEKKYVLIQKL